MTILVAFDAGARTERPDENGMAHFLEHLVFKGGEKYPTYRDVNEAAERIGAVLNAYTSHDLVAFHITARSSKALEAADLLTDFVGRPQIDGDELNRERGVVVQEIARANDQPAVMAEHLIDEAAFGDHPLGRPVLGPAEHIRDTFTRQGIVELLIVMRLGLPSCSLANARFSSTFGSAAGFDSGFVGSTASASRLTTSPVTARRIRGLRSSTVPLVIISRERYLQSKRAASTSSSMSARSVGSPPVITMESVSLRMRFSS